MNERSPRASHIINWPTFSSRVMRPSRSATRLSTFRAGVRYAGVAAGDWAETLKAQSSRARLWKAGTSAAGGRTREVIFELSLLSHGTTGRSAWSIADTVAGRWWGGPRAHPLVRGPPGHPSRARPPIGCLTVLGEAGRDTPQTRDSLENADRCARRKTGTATNSRLWNWMAVPGLPTPSYPRHTPPH